MNSLNKNGQALVEYILIIALVTIIIIGIVSVFGGYLKDAMTKTSCSISETKYIKGDKPGQGACENKKTGDYYEEVLGDE